MSYRGFTWNLTYTEYANVARILTQLERCECGTLRHWDLAIARALRNKIVVIMEVSPDGSSPTHGPADA